MRNALLILALLATLAIGITLALRPSQPPPAASEPAGDEERRASEIVELVRQGKVGHARALADQFYRAYPQSPRVQEIERLTGYHPRPYGPGK